MSEYTPEHKAEDSNEEPVIGDAPPKENVLLSSSVYDKLKASSLYILPALAAAYFGIAQIWGLPKAEEVVGTVAVIETLLGAMLKVSNVQYENSDAKYDGEVILAPDEENERTEVRSRFNTDALLSKKEIVLKIDRQ